MIELTRILKSRTPLTLASAPTGFLPWLMTDLARAADGRAVFIASDELSMRALADAANWFAPEVEVLTFPSWDCLPYDRASPSLRVTSERLATLAALQRKSDKPQLLITTANAAAQRVLTPFRIRQLTAHLAPGARIDRDKLAELLQANGYVRTDTVADAGEFAVRGGLVDLYPSGLGHGLRLDFFGDEIETVRSFDPSDQRTTGRVDEGFTLLPASEALLDEEGIKRFRTRYRDLFGATATGDPRSTVSYEGLNAPSTAEFSPMNFYTRLFGPDFQDPNAPTFTPNPKTMVRKSVLSGVIVTGSTTIPLSVFLTRRTSCACCSGLMFLWMTPIPPCRAMQIAVCASVTVSIAADSSGMLRVIPRVTRLPTSTWPGSTSL